MTKSEFKMNKFLKQTILDSSCNQCGMTFWWLLSKVTHTRVANKQSAQEDRTSNNRRRKAIPHKSSEALELSLKTDRMTTRTDKSNDILGSNRFHCSVIFPLQQCLSMVSMWSPLIPNIRSRFAENNIPFQIFSLSFHSPHSLFFYCQLMETSDLLIFALGHSDVQVTIE